MATAGARVFVSCGQARDTGEAQIAHEIADGLRRLGFEPYVAVEEQTLKGLKENLFRQIEEAEYFVFVDFKRERLGCSGRRRGSLFSHQELAIAAYRELEVISFREKGVELNGISRFIQANAEEFSDRQHVPALIAQAVSDRKWDASWRNELTMDADDPTYSDAQRVGRDTYDNVHQFLARFHHVTVRNRHRSRPGINCYAYLEEVRSSDTAEPLTVPTIEHKWAGYTYPNAIIAPSAVRKFDAFWYPLGRTIMLGPTRPLIEFNVHTDWAGFLPVIDKPGSYTLTYRVISENFPAVLGHFRLTLGEKPGSVAFERERA